MINGLKIEVIITMMIGMISCTMWIGDLCAIMRKMNSMINNLNKLLEWLESRLMTIPLLFKEHQEPIAVESHMKKLMKIYI